MIANEPSVELAPATSVGFIKTWSSRFFFVWNPSQENFQFKDEISGTGSVEGILPMSGSITGTWFNRDTIYNGELLRQNGAIAGGQNYLFQRFGFDIVRVLHSGSRHFNGLGIAIAQSTGSNYSNKMGELQSNSTSGAVYGLIFRNSYCISENWETQGKLQYLIGAIKQLEVGMDMIARQKKFLILFGLNYAKREYVENVGRQTSYRLSLGIGKEF